MTAGESDAARTSSGALESGDPFRVGRALTLEAGMALFAAAAKRRRGELTGDDEGRVLVRDADTWMRSHSIRAPERMARICAPRVCR